MRVHKHTVCTGVLRQASRLESHGRSRLPSGRCAQRRRGLEWGALGEAPREEEALRRRASLEAPRELAEPRLLPRARAMGDTSFPCASACAVVVTPKQMRVSRTTLRT